MKKIIALLLAVLMLASVLVACGGGGKPTDNNNGGNSNGDPFYGENNISLLVWAPDNAVSLTKQLCADFIAKYPDKTITIDVQAQGEADAAAQMLNDLDKAADVFGFVCNNINKLQQGNALAPVVDDYLEDVKSRNTDFAVSTGTLTVDGKETLLAYPETGENGYYLVYDKKYVSDDDAKSLEGILAACQKAGKKCLINIDNGFYGCMPLYTGGMVNNGLKEDGTQIFNDYDEEKVLDSLEAFANLFHQYSDTFISADPARIGSGMAEDPSTVAAGIDGSWNAATVANVLGENYGAAKLPTINIKGTDTQIIGMNGAKLIGVNSHSKFPEAAQVLANYLTSEEVQQTRLDELNWLPSNKNAQQSETVKKSPALSALLAQSEFSIPQINIAETFWTPIGTLGAKLFKEDDYSRDTLKKEFEKAVKNVLDE
ncbi:extracellular solute-binding protein [Ruminococcus sp.]|uniref:extracellular solute-binding protein n=1 Tax=Ruminococcus sp. TaxID=41978 RepID=UPI003890999C